jgi:hypothetical protein
MNANLVQGAPITGSPGGASVSSSAMFANPNSVQSSFGGQSYGGGPAGASSFNVQFPTSFLSASLVGGATAAAGPGMMPTNRFQYNDLLQRTDRKSASIDVGGPSDFTMRSCVCSSNGAWTPNFSCVNSQTGSSQTLGSSRPPAVSLNMTSTAAYVRPTRPNNRPNRPNRPNLNNRPSRPNRRPWWQIG